MSPLWLQTFLIGSTVLCPYPSLDRQTDFFFFFLFFFLSFFLFLLKARCYSAQSVFKSPVDSQCPTVCKALVDCACLLQTLGCLALFLPKGHYCACQFSLRMISHSTTAAASQFTSGVAPPTDVPLPLSHSLCSAGPRTFGLTHTRQGLCIFSPANVSYVNHCSD